MHVLPTWLGYRIARAVAPAEPTHMSGEAYATRGKLRVLLGDPAIQLMRGKRVIDFGCGDGAESVEMAATGVAHVVGIDIQDELLARARIRADAAGVGDRCTFARTATEQAEIVVSIDSFEHFAEPAAVLRTMYDLLLPGGVVLASFGPTWYHPLGGHLFSIFPWAHLVLSEQALIRWRNHIRSDGATRFAEVAGGLNQITIGQFETMVRASDFALEHLECVPIAKLRRVHSVRTREWTTAIVRCTLRKQA